MDMSIRWLRNVLIDDQKSTIEIQIGDRRIGDKCYTRINTEVECWFDNIYDTRNDIIAQGIDILRKKLENKKVSYPDGKPYDWQ
ncbi:MAG: hypothetical protein GX640_23235 [Fibrobacter sp.]|nr:hypothetical protein [Fibrobacter sp.]